MKLDIGSTAKLLACSFALGLMLTGCSSTGKKQGAAGDELTAEEGDEAGADGEDAGKKKKDKKAKGKMAHAKKKKPAAE